MRKTLDRYADGFFGYDTTRLVFSVPKIEESVPVGELFEGTFGLSSESGNVFSANIFTSDMRMVCLVESVESAKEMIRYTFDSTGLEAGDVVSGEIKVVSSIGEYYLPFSFQITYGIIQSSIGNVRNLFHFANEAQTNFDEAVDLFYSKAFAQVFGGNDRMHYNKYRGFLNREGDPQSVDDFIVAVNKKRIVEYTVDRNTYEYNDIFENVKCELVIRKSTWGNVDVKLSTDSTFLQLDKNELKAEDFNGGSSELVFYIIGEKLHEGKNFGRITITSAYQEIDVTIIARQRATASPRRKSIREKRNLTVRLMRRYIEFRMKKCDASTWVRESMKIVERLNALDDKNPVSRLFQVQLLTVQGRINDAAWILEHVENEMNIAQRGDESYAYFLYLKTLISRDVSYIDSITHRVSKMYEEHPDSIVLLWILLYLDEELAKNPARKIKMIENLFAGGCTSPILYIEAYNFYTAYPERFAKLNKFEIQVMMFALKQGAMAPDLLRQFVYVAGKTRDFEKTIYKLLALAYDVTEDPEIVDIICSLLIKGNISGPAYFKWFDKAVKMQLRITRLYEYYMYCIPYDYEMVIPKSVLMYFGYRNDMNYHKIAFMYANLIKHKRENAESYEAYKEHMQVFAIEQIALGHIDSNLAVLYEDVLFVEMIKPEMASPLSHIIFANEVKLDDLSARSVVLIEDQFEGERVFPVENGFAYPTIYSSNYTLFSEDGYGRRRIIDKDRVKKLLNEAVYIPAIRYYVMDNVYFAMYLCEGKKNYVAVDESNVEFCRMLAQSQEVSEYYKRDIRMALIKYYYDNDQITVLDDFLSHLDVAVLGSKDRADVIKYMVRRGMFMESYDIIAKYGVNEVSAKECVKICSHMIERKDMLADKMLVKLCYHAFNEGKYDAITLKYLVENYNGPTKELRNIWKAATELNMECLALMERLIMQMLYTHTTVGQKEEIFEAYSRSGASTKVKVAYLSYCAYEYFAKERLTPDSVFDNIVDLYREGQTLNDACKLALLKYYSEEQKDYKEGVKRMLKSFLVDFMHRNVYFKFFSYYSELVPEISDYMDKTIIEYRTNPEYRVTLHYILDGSGEDSEEYHTEEMKNMFGGIFSKEFVLFFGENLQYYITEDQGGREVFTQSDSVSISDTTDNRVESRYTMLNDMVVSKTVQDEDTLLELMKDYVEADAFAKRIFKIR